MVEMVEMNPKAEKGKMAMMIVEAKAVVGVLVVGGGGGGEMRAVWSCTRRLKQSCGSRCGRKDIAGL